MARMRRSLAFPIPAPRGRNIRAQGVAFVLTQISESGPSGLSAPRWLPELVGLYAAIRSKPEGLTELSRRLSSGDTAGHERLTPAPRSGARFKPGQSCTRFGVRSDHRIPGVSRELNPRLISVCPSGTTCWASDVGKPDPGLSPWAVRYRPLGAGVSPPTIPPRWVSSGRTEAHNALSSSLTWHRRSWKRRRMPGP
jgi:hypothetical protein